MYKRLIILLLILGVLAFTKSVKALNLCPNSKAHILIECETGKILDEHNKDLKLPMASMTKVMSLAIVYDAISSKKINYETNITCSINARKMGGSQVYLEEGETHSLREMLKCITIASANDAMVAVCEAIYGTEEYFVTKMNEKAHELGMFNTHYMDSTGLTDTNHYTTAYDMSTISRYLVQNYPEILTFTSMKEAYFREKTEKPFWLVNTNKLIGKVKGVDGLKTGWTNASGYCITATAKRDNLRLIGVVMGYDNPTVRNTEVVNLLNYGFTNFEKRLIMPKGNIIYAINDIKYSPNNFNIVAKKDLYIIVMRNSKQEEISYEVKKHPNAINQEDGVLAIYYGDELIDEVSIGPNVVIKKRNFIDLWLNVLKKYLT